MEAGNEKSKFYLQGTDRSKESFNRPEQVQFEWNIAYACNFRCSYCFFEGKWEEYGKRNIFLSVPEWMKRWERMHRLYGRSSILITGGEPFIYPDFLDLVKALSAFHYPINISTNTSGDLKKFAAMMDPSRVSVTLSFHPRFNALPRVLALKKFLKGSGFDSEFINFVCYPPFFKDMDRWVNEAAEAGEKLKVIPYNGPFGGRNYPDGYSIEEKQKLGIGSSWEENVKRRGKVCKSGMRSALIFPDAKVVRCGQIGERFIIGNFLDDSFRLLEKPLPCEVEYCPCLEADLSEENDGKRP
ncbi:MAG: radical SAM protein [Endomicrobiales bacterium]